MTDGRHGVPSASAFYRIANCPGSFQLGKAAEAQGLVPPPAEECGSGTRIHRWLETQADEDWQALSHQEQQTAARCDEQMRSLLPPDFRGLIMRECRLGVTKLGVVGEVNADSKGDFLFTGMADAIAIEGKSAIIFDFKTGRGEVEEAKYNSQLRVLAALVWGTLNLNVRVAIIQPLAGEPSVAEFTADSARHAFQWSKAVALEAIRTDTELPLTAGDWCQYCPARAACPKLRSEVTSAPAILAPERLPVEPKEAVSALTARALNLPGEELARLLAGRRLLNWYLAALEGAARIRLERGEAVPGWELREKSGRRKIEDAHGAASLVAPLLAGADGGPTAALMRSATLRPAALTEEIQKASGKKSATRYNMTGADAKRALADALGDLMTQSTSLTLAEVGRQLDDTDD